MNPTALIPAFSPSSPGTPESIWDSLLSECESWTPPQGPLWVVSPHPDDEILGAGGLISSWASAGRSVTVVSVTDGEAVYPHWSALGGVRRQELNAALRRLATRHVTLIRLGIPDGEVRGHQARLYKFLWSVIDSNCTLIAPFERDGHPDHDAVGEVCVRLARLRSVRLARYMVWRWHHGDPRPLFAARWGKFQLSSEMQRAKAQAWQSFASQLHPAQGGAIIPDQVRRYFERSYEAFLL
jgi:LmbE family N-acetylglucosaminyl deacetylase